jgi:predicted RNase H-like nuclease (RuvC/YqgF family)
VLEFEATLRTAELEAGVERAKAEFSSLETSIESTGDTLSSLFGALSGFEGSYLEKSRILQAIRQEMELREKSFELQEKMLTAQTKYYDTLESRLRSGDPWIEIKSDGLEQYLEEFMWAILKRIQTRAVQNAEEFLIGLPAV